MKPARAVDAVIVGAGFAGTVVAASLARTAPASFRATIFDPHAPGPGTAYSPVSDRLLMNGAARAMSAVPGDEAHLVRWLGGNCEDRLIPRQLFGKYLAEQFDRALATHAGIALSRSRVVDIERREHGLAVRDEAGNEHLARMVVLALGNPPPDDAFLPTAVREDAGYVRDPWHFDASVLRGDAIALIGSGLTAMDAIALLDERGYPGTIHLISRRGLLPALEDVCARGLDPRTLNLDTRTPLRLLRSMRAAAKAHELAGGDWREVAESIRKSSPAIWASWSVRERERYLEHLQSYWIAHRYRVPPATALAYGRMDARGAIARHRGRIAAAGRNGERLTLHIATAKGASAIEVSDIVNCTGPQCDYDRALDPLAVSLRERGLVRADRLHLGLETTADLRAVDRFGNVGAIYTLGPPTRGLWYESTAVPEIRHQAARIAQSLVRAHARASLVAVS